MESIVYLRDSSREWQRRFGYARGSAMWLRARLSKSMAAGSTFAVRVPGFPAPVWMRAHGSDRDCFEQILVRDELGFALADDVRFIIDAGANIGLASIVLARRFPAARIVALEVDDDNFALLEKNVAPYPQIHPLKQALWHRDGFVKIVNPQADSWAFRVADAEEADAGAVRAISIGTLLESMRAHHVDLLKVDIEGGEFELLQSASRWLTKTRVLAIEIHEQIRPGVSQILEEAVRDMPHSRLERGEYKIFNFRGAGAASLSGAQ